MFLGLRTAVYYVNDLEKAKAWYSSVLGIQPYFDAPFYVGFNVSGFELGLHPDEGRPKGDGQVPYWKVAGAAKSLERLLELGAIEHEPLQEVGGGIRVATVKDPFGNVLGIIEESE